jgi:hypothetical protein
VKRAGVNYIFGGFIVFFAVLMPILSALRFLVRSRGDPDHGHAGLPPYRGKDGRQGVGRGNPRG